MNIISNARNVVWIAVLFSIFGLALFVFNPFVKADGAEIQPPELPALCDALAAPEGSELLFRTFATGTQNYRWNGTSWDFVAPSADLFASPNFNGYVGTHYGGPTWESNSGSKVVAARLEGCTPDASAVPWLLLETVSTGGRGIFSKVTHIQRVNTTGGLRPIAPGMTVGEEARVSYTAVYYFYKTEE